MKLGKIRFINQIAKIENLILTAKLQENPAQWLFANDMRTPMFMLEALSKLYAKLNDEELFDNLKEDFKLIEDQLGAIDYYNSYQNEFLSNNSIPVNIIDYFKEKTKHELNDLNQLLIDKNWLNGVFIAELKEILEKIDWEKEEKESVLLLKFYKKQIIKINEFVEEIGLPFTLIEEHVHEFRRRLRWLSIYPHCLNGAVRLIEMKRKPDFLQKYLIDEIVNSKYNVLPENESQKYFVEIDKNKFLSLSWMISELGKYKDKGLKISALKEAFMEIESINDSLALSKTYELLGAEPLKIEDILQYTSQITKTFLEEGNLDLIIN